MSSANYIPVSKFGNYGLALGTPGGLPVNRTRLRSGPATKLAQSPAVRSSIPRLAVSVENRASHELAALVMKEDFWKVDGHLRYAVPKESIGYECLILRT